MRVWPLEEDAMADANVGGKVTISGSDARHISTVLRQKKGDKLRLSTPDALIYEATIEAVEKDFISARITGGPFSSKLKKPDITLAFSISKPQIMELVAQKAVELGCNNLIPVITKKSFERSISPNKMERLNKIIHEAYKQSGRGVPMKLSDPMPISELPSADLKVVLWEDEINLSLNSALSSADSPSSVIVLIGPQGGLEAREVEELRMSLFKTAGIGPLILRAETACVAVLSIVSYHFGRLER